MHVKIRRWSIGLVAASLFLPGVAACKVGGTEPGAASSSASATPDAAKQALLDSTQEISKGNFRFTLAGDGSTGSGVVHMPSRSAQMMMKFGDGTSGFSMDMDLVYIEPDTWVKVKVNGADLKGLTGVDQLSSNKYLHLDKTRIKDIKDLQFDFQKVDPAGSDLLTKAVVDVKKTGDGVYTGTIDASKAGDAGMVNAAAIQALGTQAQALPFEARLDPQGRLSQLTIQIPAAGNTKAQELKVTYSDYGAATQPQRPAPSDIQEAPDQLYNLFNK